MSRLPREDAGVAGSEALADVLEPAQCGGAGGGHAHYKRNQFNDVISRKLVEIAFEGIMIFYYPESSI